MSGTIPALVSGETDINGASKGYLAAKFAPNGNLYAAGGSSLEQFDLFVMEAFHEEIEVYDPRLDAWFAAGNLSEEIADLTIQLWYGGS